MPESGLPIRVYKERDLWYVDYGDGVTQDYASQEEADSADAVAQAEERTVVVEEHGEYLHPTDPPHGLVRW